MKPQRRHWQMLVLLATFVVAGALGHAVYVWTKPPAGASAAHAVALRPGPDAVAAANQDDVSLVRASETGQAITLSVRAMPHVPLRLDDLFLIVPETPDARTLAVTAHATHAEGAPRADLLILDERNAILARVPLTSGAGSASVPMPAGRVLHGGLDVLLGDGPGSGTPITVDVRLVQT